MINVNTDTLKNYSSDLCKTLIKSGYKSTAFIKGSELFFDVAVLSYIRAKGYDVQRQFPQWFAGRMGRIDFRIGPKNPVFVEFACRTNQLKASLSGSSNRNEIDKLSRISPNSSGRRCLLLLDLAKTPIAKEKLRPAYRRIIFKGPQKNRHPVTVIYAHAKSVYSFRWRSTKKI